MALATLMARIRIEGAEQAQRHLATLRQGFTHAGDAAKSMGNHARAALRDLVGGLVDATQKATLLSGALIVGGSAAAFATAARMDSLVRSLASTSTSVTELREKLAGLRETAKLPGLGFEEALQGKVKLEAAGLAAQLADRSLRAFGNALALSGGGKAELDGVIIALSQITSKGKISAEEINQIAERVPQIRQLLSQAFGTADNEKIQAMGLSAAESIERIVAAAEQLPRATGGFQNSLENFQDALKTTIEPLGKGIGIAFGASEAALSNFLGVLARRLSEVGEVIAALGTSGVLGDVINRLTTAFDSFLGNDLQDRVAGFLANIASFIANLPQTLGETGKYLSGLFEAIGKNIVTAFEYAGGIIENIIAKIATGFAGLTQAMSNILRFDPAAALASLQGILSTASTIDAITAATLPRFTPLPEFNVRGPMADADRYKQMIKAAISPLGDLPQGLIFGGKQQSANASEEPVDMLERLLQSIERNTRQTADNLSLRAQTTGGGQLAGLGVTATELRRAGVSGFAPEGFEYLPRIPASQWEQAQRQMAREEARRLQKRGRVL